MCAILEGEDEVEVEDAEDVDDRLRQAKVSQSANRRFPAFIAPAVLSS
jgi:hypothetical protein